MPENPNRLTAKQAECLALVAEGLTSKEIARQLGIAARTVDDHVEKARIKLDAPTRQRAAAVYRARLAEEAITPSPDWAPHQVRREPPQVAETAIDTAVEVTAPRLSDSGMAAFEHFPVTAPTPVPFEPKDVDRQKLSPLVTCALVLGIAAALALIGLSYPQLVREAENASTFIKSHSSHRGTSVPR